MDKIARVINRYIVQPCDRYHIPEIIGISTALTASAIFLYWLSWGDRLQSSEEKSAEETQDEQKDSLRNGKPKRLSPLKPKISEEEKSILKKFIDWLCGSLPASKSGIWFVNEEVVRSEKDYTMWNSCACFVHNLLSPDPLAAVIHTFYAYLFKDISLRAYGLSQNILYKINGVNHLVVPKPMYNRKVPGKFLQRLRLIR